MTLINNARAALADHEAFVTRGWFERDGELIDGSTVRKQLAAALTALLELCSKDVTDGWERKTENRIHYSYGVNSGTYSGFPYGMTASHTELQRRFESDTSGPVDVTKRESRTVIYGPWGPAEVPE